MVSFKAQKVEISLCADWQPEGGRAVSNWRLPSNRKAARDTARTVVCASTEDLGIVHNAGSG